MSFSLSTHLDITPSPRVLRTLGEIPFEPWQCFAELIDNSIDAFDYADRSQIPLTRRQIVVSWSSESAAAIDRRIEIRDTGPGMSLEIIREAVRAGFSSKNPMSDLGLFGMGFNIATARLGEETIFLSTKNGDSEWVGIQIDFDSMIQNKDYQVPIIRLEKNDPTEHGTRVIIKKLKPSIFERLKSKEGQIRSTLEDIYSPILQGDQGLELLVQSKKCKPRPYCLWDENRYVIHASENVPAIIPIDEVVGTSLFSIIKNRYLSYEEEEEAFQYKREHGFFQSDIVEREKRISGWLGIQRYSDTSFFGIDFVRNGRKILRKDKSLFSYFIDLTGTNKLEYPTELGSTWGGRIVGEIHVDHLMPTYQKNDFDRNDRSWYEVLNILRGDGPILPKTRTELGYSGANVSPLGKLIKAYARMNPGTKCLAISNATAKDWSKKFDAGNSDYQTDIKWWEAALQADQEKANKGAATAGPVNHGSTASDSVDEYGPPDTSSTTITNTGNTNTAVVSDLTSPVATTIASTQNTTTVTPPYDEFQDLYDRSSVDHYLSKDYRYRNCPASLNVEARKMTSGFIGSGSSSDGDPVRWDMRNARDYKFYYNDGHPFFLSRKTTPQEIMLLQLAQTFSVRDRLDRSISIVYVELLEEMFPDEKIDQITIQERADNFFERLRTSSVKLLSSRESEVLDSIHEHAGDLEDTLTRLMSTPDLQVKLQTRAPGGIAALLFVPERTLVRLASRYPEEFFDGKFFNTNYQNINLPSQEATDRVREEAKERIIAYIKDALWVLSPWGTTQRGASLKRSREELLRCSHSLELLEGVIND
ncbi:ATP-binding protein [Brevibacillus sp. NRS-1366]|uniref:ATP-binding protein n=1 Tax=Brevibacillus sp. NRS-1366 TaxID=3233899 RepID=UPI003D1FBDE0